MCRHEEKFYVETKSVDLVPDGGNETVTATNARRYVDLYADYCLHLEVDSSFRAFQKGFLRVVGDNARTSAAGGV